MLDCYKLSFSGPLHPLDRITRVRPSRPNTAPVVIGELVRRRLREIKSSTDHLAEALQLPASYVEDVIAGSRVIPPGQSDVYNRMTSFLRLGRNDLRNCLPPERNTTRRTSGPGPEVRRMLLALCEPATADQLDRRHVQHGAAELTDIVRRLLDVAQAAVRRVLDDHVQLRLAAMELHTTYPMIRLRVLDFLDATPGTVTPEDITEFLAPRISRWDVELSTGVLKVVMTNSERRRQSGRELPRG